MRFGKKKERKIKNTFGRIPLESEEINPKKYRVVIDFDTSGFWQVRRSLKGMPPELLREILNSIQSVVNNKY